MSAKSKAKPKESKPKAPEAPKTHKAEPKPVAPPEVSKAPTEAAAEALDAPRSSVYADRVRARMRD